MTRLRILLHRLSGLLRGRSMDRRLDEEIASHLAEAEDDYVLRGLPRADARRLARRQFGGPTQIREVHREVRSVAWLEDAARDARFAARSLWRSPTFAFTAGATLALAIGAATAMFGVVNAVLLRPLPYDVPDTLAMIWTEDPAQSVREGRSARGDVEQWLAQSQTFADIATYDGVSTVWQGPDGAEPVAGAAASPNLFALLGVRAVLGRGFSKDDAGQPVVLISHRFWQARFGGAPGALGTTVVLDGMPATIVGVLPADFRLPSVDADVWKPQRPANGVRGPRTWFAVGRLRPGVPLPRAQAEITAIARPVNADLPIAERSGGIAVVPMTLSFVGPQARLALWLLAAAVGCVVLIAIANVTSLSLARAATRAREMHVRTALGARTGRIVRQLATEGAVLALLSGVAGTTLAGGALGLVRAFGPADLPRLTDARLGLPALAGAVVLSLTAGLISGLAPAFAVWRGDARAPAGEAGVRVTGGVPATRMRRALVVAELALAIVLLVGAGLLLRSWQYVIGLDPGFSARGVVVMDVRAPTTVPPARRAALYQRVVEEIQTMPGGESVGIAGDFFISNPRDTLVTVERSGGPVSERLRLTSDEISPALLDTLGTPLRDGRAFTDADDLDALPVAIVNETMARRAWPGEPAVGRRFALGPLSSGTRWYTVVGVAANMRRQGPEREALPQVFVPLAQTAAPQSVDVFVRSATGDASTMASALRVAVGRVDGSAPVGAIAALDQQFDTYLTQRRFQTALLTGFSVLALLMSAIGIYGLIQYSVATRTREIGLRLAIGAQRGDILRMVIREGLALSLTGIAIGLAGAWWLMRASTSLLAGVSAGDPLTLIAVPLLLAVVAAIACYVPARRATRVDPLAALRTP